MNKKKSLQAIDAHIGQQLRDIRILRDLSQEKLAEAVDLTFQQVQKYEKGMNRISASRLHQFSLILEVEITLFFAGIKQPSSKPIPALSKEHWNLIRHYDAAPLELRKTFLNFLKSVKIKNAGSK